MLPTEIKALRKTLDLNQSEFSKKIGYIGNPMVVSRWERGVRSPSKQAIMLMEQIRNNITQIDR